MSDRDIDRAAVEREHLAEAQAWRQAAYLAGVVLLGSAAMLVLIAVLGSR